MHTVLKILEKFTSIRDEVKAELMHTLARKTVLKGELLLEQGDVCRNIYMVEKGFFRGYYFQKRKMVTSWFAVETDVISSMYSFVTQKPSNECIEALEDSVLYGISYTQLQLLYRHYPEFNVVGRLLTEKYFIDMEERALSLQSHSAHERYERLVKTKPQLLQRASLGQIASYIGVSQETLSRIRAKQ